VTARKARPWAVILTIDSRPPLRTEHTSEAKTYEKVRAEVADVRSGYSRVTEIRVEQWDRDGGRWILFDTIDPKEWG
jgi:hypothetical protein